MRMSSSSQRSFSMAGTLIHARIWSSVTTYR